MQYHEFLKLSGESEDTCSEAHFNEVIVPNYMAFDGLSKEAFCIMHIARKASDKIYELRREMAKGFKSQSAMEEFNNRAIRIIETINKTLTSK